MSSKCQYSVKSALLALAICTLPVQADVVRLKSSAANEIMKVTDEAWQPEGFVNGTTIPASYHSVDEITIDGIDDEHAWLAAEETELSLTHGTVKSVAVKALYTDREVFLRVRWRDDDENRQYRPWVWDSASQRYVEGSQLEDSVMLSFEAGCEWTPSLLGGYPYDFDAWHWLAARSDPVGQALDLYGNVQDQKMPGYEEYASRVTENDWQLKFTDHAKDKLYADWDQLERVYMRQPVTRTLFVQAVPDGIRSTPAFFERRTAPTSTPYPHEQSEAVAQFTPVKLTGGSGEVSARGEWVDGYWTVEFRRILVTPAKQIYDTVFERLTQFSVHVFDGTDRVDESSESGRLFLRFLSEEETLARRNGAPDLAENTSPNR